MKSATISHKTISSTYVLPVACMTCGVLLFYICVFFAHLAYMSNMADAICEHASSPSFMMRSVLLICSDLFVFLFCVVCLRPVCFVPIVATVS